VLPLADDAILGASLTPGVSAFVGFQGVLGASGTGAATLAVPNLASLVGVPFHAAFVILDGGYAYGLRAVSPAHTFTITN
jgi:Flp pilus assembly CpaE family ATPase